MGYLDFILDPVLSPLLRLHPFWSILIISLVITVMITLVYKWATDQDLMKRLKTEIKDLQSEMKELKGDPAKAMEVQKKAMKTNMEYMMKSMKPTLFTLIPIILIFGWLNAHMAYIPIGPGIEFTTTATFQKGTSGNALLDIPEGLTLLGATEQDIVSSMATWSLKGETGIYTLTYTLDDEVQTKDLIISNRWSYAPVEKKLRGGTFKSLNVNNEPLKPLEGFSLFGWRPGWLAFYILFSIVFSLVLRKALKIY